MFRRKPNLKDVTTQELFDELTIRFRDSDIRIYDVPLFLILSNVDYYVNAGVLNKTRKD